jgi:soluble lytic murein transglycosylase-like protein
MTPSHRMRPARIPLLLTILITTIGVGCASRPPVAPQRAGSTGTADSTGEIQTAALGANEKNSARAPNAVPRADEQALAFALRVLEHRGSETLDAGEREGVARVLSEAESEHGISVVLLLAMMELESRFDPHATGPAGSIGLMQLQPATARAVAKRHGLPWSGEGTLRDPEINAQIGVAYLGELQTRFGTTDYALAAYNIGPANLRRLLKRRELGRGPYLTKVYANVDDLREAYLD